MNEYRMSRKQEKSVSENEEIASIGPNRSFAMEEAHKRLRTNVFFSFAGENSSRVIGITSTVAHEGKSTTSINLAYDIMKAGKKVLLIDADMRLSNMARTLSLRFSPGLSNILVGDNNGEGLVQKVALLENLSVICCGDIPPNPTELLSSQRIGVLLETLKKSYDYIIVDLPPVSDVSDALILSKLTDGMIVVVRQGHAEKKLLHDTVRQLKNNGARIIGFVMNGTRETGRYYYNKYRRKKYAYGAYIYRQYGDKK
ncbi:MAG: CpsD/CapB family tyrosine-protein kinase [Clostridia bacterium]|nr:CpsD/CapB family tyrosine-protein kinase [Clostridia bacterium]